MNIAHKKKVAEKYGINDKSIEKLEQNGWLKSLKREEVCQLLGRDNIPCGGLLIRNPAHPEAIRIRLDVPFAPSIEDKPLRYLSPIGQTNYAFIPAEHGVSLEHMSEIWVVEGEFKALCGASHGLPTIGISGIWSWRSDNNSDQAKISKLTGSDATADIDDANAIICDFKNDLTGKRFVLAFDSDINQYHVGWSSFDRFAEELYARGADEVKILITPAVKGFDKTGLDDYFVASFNNNITVEAAIENLQTKISQLPVYLPKGNGAELQINRILVKGEDMTKADRIRATALTLAKDGKARAKEFIKRFGNQKTAIFEEAIDLVKKTQRYYRRKIRRDSLDNLPQIVKEAFLQNSIEGVPGDLFKDNLFKEVFEVFSNSGIFYRSDNNEGYYHYQDEIISLDSHEFNTLFINKTTFPSTASDKGRYIMERIQAKVQAESQWVDLKTETFYDKKTNTLYLYMGRGKMLKITAATNPETVDVGTDGVLFLQDNSMEEWEYLPYTEDDEKQFKNTLLKFNFSSTSRISREHIEMLILCWITASRFRELNPTRPIPVAKGMKGSGKTTWARNVLRILKGKKGSVLAVDFKKKDQVLNILTHESLAVFDNVDSGTHGIEDILASNATGGTMQTRVLFSTNDTAQYEMITWLIITTRNPEFLRDDIVDRLIPLDFDKLENIIAENQIFEVTAQKRNQFQSIIADICRQIVVHIAENGLSTQNESLRMADFASFLRTYLRAFDPANGDQICDRIVAELKAVQQFWLIDNDAIIECIKGLIEDKGIQYEVLYKGTELITKIKSRAKENMIYLELKDTKEFYTKMRERKEALENICGIRFEEVTPHGVVHIKFLAE